ncbi:MAG: FecR family protein [Elusimicrobiota bacterium]
MRKQFLLPLLLIGFMCAPVFAAKKDVSGVVSNVIGTAQIQRGSAGAWANAKIGDFVYDGDSVKTLPRSRALISFSNGVEARLHANTLFSVVPKGAGKKAEGSTIKMNIGRLWAKVLRQKTKFDIKTPVATISVRGTEYETGVGEKGNTTVKVFDGEVEVGNEYGNKKLKKGQMNSTNPGNPPGDAKDMGEGDKDNWQDEVKSAGSVKIELKKQEAMVNEVVEGKVSVYDSQGKLKTDFSKEIKISCDSADVTFSKSGEEKWAASLSVAPDKGEVSFKVKTTAGGTKNISASGEGLGAGMASLSVKLPEKKTLKIKIMDAEGKQKELQLKFVPK